MSLLHAVPTASGVRSGRSCLRLAPGALALGVFSSGLHAPITRSTLASAPWPFGVMCVNPALGETTVTSDEANRAPDPRPQIAGPGMPGATFQCWKCRQYRSLFGRRLRRVRGLRQYVCKGCAQ
jgi:hypothetical protein